MTNQPVVSVLMTAYNREQYIAQAIESVLASSFADFELIIVDDRSTDHTVEVVQRYLSDSRVQLHINDHNLGDYPNRNRAAEYARGDYLKYVDSDDIIYPHGLTVMVDAMATFPYAGLGLSVLRADTNPYPLQLTPKEAYQQHFLGGGLLVNAPLSTIIRRQAFWDVDGFSGMRYVGDNEMWLRMAARSPVVKMVPGLTWWRPHGDQEFFLGSQSLLYHRLLYQIGMSALSDVACPLSSSEIQIARQKMKASHVRLILSLAIKSKQIRTAYGLMRESELTLKDIIHGGISVFTR